MTRMTRTPLCARFTSPGRPRLPATVPREAVWCGSRIRRRGRRVFEQPTHRHPASPARSQQASSQRMHRQPRSRGDSRRPRLKIRGRSSLVDKHPGPGRMVGSALHGRHRPDGRSPAELSRATRPAPRELVRVLEVMRGRLIRARAHRHGRRAARDRGFAGAPGPGSWHRSGSARLRSSFRGWASKRTNPPRELSSRRCSPTRSGASRRQRMRGRTLFERRRSVMDD